MIVTIAIASEEENKCCTSRRRHGFPHHTALASQSATFSFKSGRGNSPKNLFSASSFKHSQCMKNDLPFLQAFSGCDTSSSFYRQGKKIVKLILRNKTLLQITQVFMSKHTHPDSIADTEQNLLVALYGRKDDNTLNGFRFRLFAK
ncbi:hypothetical protein AVEN_54426-1 [Araneus ventricosus]|uniref:Uncharacterized protein n=1 Tax=Araneus ventricosus TaxID=182803 RepID=A0A4Y2D9G8_ARAVE|nr:hypothetical protein AVEN_54426-1 [Araneus ventricosus]